MTKTYFLGTGWAVPTKKRDSSAILINSKDKILFDCGGNVAQKLIKMDIKPKEIDRIHLTHAHTDHIDGLPGLLHSSWLSGRKKDIEIISTPKAIEKTKKIIESHEFNFPFKIKYREITGQGKLENNVEYREVEHKEQAVAYRYRDITYSGDTKPCENLNQLAQKTELLIHESTFPVGKEKKARETGHSTVKDALETAIKTSTKKIALIHHKPEINIKKEINKARKQLNNPKIDIIAPKDLDSVKT